MIIPTIEQIATIVHDALRRYSEVRGEGLKPQWEDIDPARKITTLNGVKFHFSEPDATPAEAHQFWMDEKIKTGWRFGVAYSDSEKTHPHLLPFYSLPPDQRLKAHLIKAIVNTFSPGYTKDV